MNKSPTVMCLANKILKRKKKKRKRKKDFSFLEDVCKVFRYVVLNSKVAEAKGHWLCFQAGPGEARMQESGEISVWVSK